MSTFVRNVGVKKRKRVSSKGLRTRPEIKQYNMKSAASTYTSIVVTPFEYDPDHWKFRPYNLIPFVMPGVGTGSFERIGNKINMKWIRMKGYITIYDRLISNCKLKFFLIRVYGKTLLDSEIPLMFQTWDEVDYAESDVWVLLAHMRHNYYKAVLNPNVIGRDKGVVVNRIGEVKLHPSSHAMDARTLPRTEIALSSSVAVVPQYNEINTTDLEAIDNIPLDIKISIQETVDCTKDHYFLLIMQDYPYVSGNDMKS